MDNLLNLLTLFNVAPRGLFLSEAAAVAKRELALGVQLPIRGAEPEALCGAAARRCRCGLHACASTHVPSRMCLRTRASTHVPQLQSAVLLLAHSGLFEAPCWARSRGSTHARSRPCCF